MKFLLVLCLAGIPARALAQASITGTVTDPSGALIGGVAVLAASPALIERTPQAMTDDDGQYRIEDLRPGTQLLVGPLGETLDVVEELPAVDVHNANRETALGRDTVKELPAVRSDREPPVWDRYRHYIFGAVALLFAQTALIGALLVQRLRRRQAEQRLVASQAKLVVAGAQISDLGRRLIQAQEDERARIARELHDDLGQQAALVVADLQKAADLGERFARVALSRAHNLAKSVHDLSHRLHPATLRLLGLPAALTSLQHELARPGVDIAVTHENVPNRLPEDVTLCLYRVVQEALHNALRHSGAREIIVHLRGSESVLTVSIIDDGAGFDVAAGFGGGLGLVSMNERLEAIGGTLRVLSAPGEGTRLRIKVPVGADQSVKLAG